MGVQCIKNLKKEKRTLKKYLTYQWLEGMGFNSERLSLFKVMFGKRTTIRQIMQRFCNPQTIRQANDCGDLIVFLITKTPELIVAFFETGTEKDYPHYHLFQCAIAVNHKEAVRAFIKAGLDVNSGRGSPLFSAAMNGRVEIIKALIEAGAKIDTLDYCSIRAAAENNHTKALKVLIGAGLNAGANIETFLCVLSEIIKRSDKPTEMIKTLIEAVKDN